MAAISAHAAVPSRRHSLALLRDKLRRKSMRTATEIANARHGQLVLTAGIVTCRQRPATASGVIFVTLEDETDHVKLPAAISTKGPTRAVTIDA